MLCMLALSGCPADNQPAGETEDAGIDAGRDDLHQAPRAGAGSPKPADGTTDRPDAGGSGGSEPNAPVAGSGGSKPNTPVAGGSGAGVGGGTSKPDVPGTVVDKPTTGSDVARRLFMPTDGPANTRAPKLLLDRAGNLHAIYPAYAGGDAYYAFCADGCRDPNAIEVVRLPTQGTVLNAMLALTRSGAPRVLLSTALDVVWAQCDADCGAAKSWQSSVILAHAGEREVTGNALALDANDRPRFVMHTYLALLGIGQKPPQTFYVQCDDACTQPSSWRSDSIQDGIFQASQLRFDPAGRAHLATVAVTVASGGPTARQAAYLVCDRDCSSAAAWSGIVLMPAYEDYAKEISPAIGLALTTTGAPRIAVVGKSESGAKMLMYFECDNTCDEDNWRVAAISDRAEIGSGVDIRLDDGNHPRIAFTLADNIGIYHCEGSDCAGAQATWDLSKVEFAVDIPKDNIILWPNCTIDGWVLRDPSLVLGAGGSAFVGYQATDLSGGARTLDPTKPACLAGKDMTLSRLALMPSYKN
jgi:hypothetical protein